ncbi:MAG: formylmethanofuran dehydrogenase subunit C [Candidatus Bathyarchaeia archaeon]
MEIVLNYRNTMNLPLDLSPLTPEALDGMSAEDVGKVKVYAGKRMFELSRFFKVEERSSGEDQPLKLTIMGDLRNARRIGFRMKTGEIRVEGNGGIYLGEGMKGGVITVEGDVDSWAGSGMRGGSIAINGSAGDFLGASYRGAGEGMSGGVIQVKGSVGCEGGGWMKGGLIHVKGSAGPFLGVHMQGGSILVEGDCASRMGAEMTGGRIAILGAVPNILPSFTLDSVRTHADLVTMKVEGAFYMFTGDNNEQGQGRIYVAKDKNPHFTWFEKYLGRWE